MRFTIFLMCMMCMIIVALHIFRTTLEANYVV